jgi:hypothetical protein
VYIGIYLLMSGNILQCIKIFKNTAIELSTVDFCEDEADKQEESKNEEEKSEQKLMSEFSFEEFAIFVSCTDNNYFVTHDPKLCSAFSEIVPPPPKQFIL